MVVPAFPERRFQEFLSGEAKDESDYWKGVSLAYEELLTRRGRANEAHTIKLLWWAYAMLPPSALTDPRAREIGQLLGRERHESRDQ